MRIAVVDGPRLTVVLHLQLYIFCVEEHKYNHDDTTQRWEECTVIIFFVYSPARRWVEEIAMYVRKGLGASMGQQQICFLDCEGALAEQKALQAWLVGRGEVKVTRERATLVDDSVWLLDGRELAGPLLVYALVRAEQASP